MTELVNKDKKSKHEYRQKNGYYGVQSVSPLKLFYKLRCNFSCSAVCVDNLLKRPFALSVFKNIKGAHNYLAYAEERKLPREERGNRDLVCRVKNCAHSTAERVRAFSERKPQNTKFENLFSNFQIPIAKSGIFMV